MKKTAIFVAAVLLLAIIAIEFLIPDNNKIEQTTTIVSSEPGLYRAIADTSNWKNWWPEKETFQSSNTILRDINYTYKDRTTSSIFVALEHNSSIITSSLNFIPVSKDTVKLQWTLSTEPTYNPLKRLSNYLRNKEINIQLKELLTAIKTYYTVPNNIYGLPIVREQVKNSSLVFTYDSAQGLPTTEKIYSMVDELRSYIKKNKATVTDSPMVNIFTKDSVNYLTKVALPASTRLPSSGKITYKWMLPQGNILTAMVTGPDKNITPALRKIENYIDDYKLTSPAIPFYSLQTNRMVEKDSSKWISKIYYPVMYY